jgi:hypothetical protein
MLTIDKQEIPQASTEQLAAKFADAPSFKSLYEQIALPFLKNVATLEPKSGRNHEKHSKLLSQPNLGS